MKSEPVVTAASIAGLIVAGASIFNIVLELGTVETLVAAILPVVASFFARDKVTPVG